MQEASLATVQVCKGKINKPKKGLLVMNFTNFVGLWAEPRRKPVGLNRQKAKEKGKKTIFGVFFAP